MSFYPLHSSTNQSSVAAADGGKRKKTVSISARRIEMRTVHCCWGCWVHFCSLFQVLRLSRIYCLGSVCFFFFARETRASRLQTLSLSENNAHAICNRFEERKKYPKLKKHIRFTYTTNPEFVSRIESSSKRKELQTTRSR